MSAAAQIRTWMKQVLTDSGMSVVEWSAKSGVAKSTIHRALKPDYEFVTSSRTLAKLANVANTTPPQLTNGSGGASATRTVQPTFLPVRYKAQAGQWFEVDELAQTYAAQYPVAPDPRYASFPQWLEEVVGDSVDLKIPEGGFAHVVDAIQLGYAPRDGDYVVVERKRAGGQLRERTIKQVAIDAGRVQLWPRSTNPRWQSPLDLTAGAAPGEDIEVAVVGLVIGAYSPF